MAKRVRISWNWIDWEPGFTWAKDIWPQLDESGVGEEAVERCVYVIRTNGLFAIQYPAGISPTLYIGEGNLKSRFDNHRKWLQPIRDLVGDFSFQVGVCIPRVKNNYTAYQDFEAALLQEFRSIYGCAPLKNAQMENRSRDYSYEPVEEVRSAIMIGKGMRYEWALKPMKSSALFDSYWKTQTVS